MAGSCGALLDRMRLQGLRLDDAICLLEDAEWNSELADLLAGAQAPVMAQLNEEAAETRPQAGREDEQALVR